MVSTFEWRFSPWSSAKRSSFTAEYAERAERRICRGAAFSTIVHDRVIRFSLSFLKMWICKENAAPVRRKGGAFLGRTVFVHKDRSVDYSMFVLLKTENAPPLQTFCGKFFLIGAIVVMCGFGSTPPWWERDQERIASDEEIPSCLRFRSASIHDFLLEKRGKLHHCFHPF